MLALTSLAVALIVAGRGLEASVRHGANTAPDVGDGPVTVAPGRSGA